MAIKSLEELVEIGKTSARETFQKNGELHALVFVHDVFTDGIASFEFKSESENVEYRMKMAIVGAMGQLRRMGRFGGALIMAEAWMAAATDILPGMRPADSPKRSEHILLTAYDSVGNKRMVTCKISRANGVAELGEWETFKGEFEGWFDKAFTDAEKILASK